MGAGALSAAWLRRFLQPDESQRHGHRDRHDHGTGACTTRVPSETAGPYPGDGSNGPNVLGLTGVVRSDIRSSFAGLSGTADGVPVDARPDDRLLVDVRAAGRTGRVPLALRPAGTLLAVLVWCHEPELPARRAGGRRQRRRDVHDDLPGLLCGPLAAHPLRGVSKPLRRDQRRQQDRDVADRAAEDGLRRGLRLAGYESSVTNLSRVSLASDNVFSDGSALELATVTGSAAAGMTAALTVAV